MGIKSVNLLFLLFGSLFACTIRRTSSVTEPIISLIDARDPDNPAYDSTLAVLPNGVENKEISVVFTQTDCEGEIIPSVYALSYYSPGFRTQGNFAKVEVDSDDDTLYHVTIRPRTMIEEKNKWVLFVKAEHSLNELEADWYCIPLTD